MERAHRPDILLSQRVFETGMVSVKSRVTRDLDVSWVESERGCEVLMQRTFLSRVAIARSHPSDGDQGGQSAQIPVRHSSLYPTPSEGKAAQTSIDSRTKLRPAPRTIS